MIILLEIPKELEDDYRKDLFNDFFERVHTGYYVEKVKTNLLTLPKWYEVDE